MRTLIFATFVSLTFTPFSSHAQTAEIQKLHSSSASSSDLFGLSVAASGARSLVGAPHEGALASTSGAAYVFDRLADGSWSTPARLLPGDGSAGDSFGQAVALSGDRALVSAHSDDGPQGSDQGSAYVFDRQPNGTWLEVAKLTPIGAAAADQFGAAVALAGDYAAVGARRNDDIGTNAGKVWVFERQVGGAWIEVASLTASDATEFDDFGTSLAMSGQTLMVGAPGQAVQSGQSVGAVYVFERTGGGWPEVQKLVGMDSASLDDFGFSVALDGERLVVGAWLEDAGGNSAGAAYVFEREAGTWVEEKVVASDAASNDLFGYSVAFAGDHALVGARNDDDFGSSSGSAYVFDVEPLSATGATISLSQGGAQPLELDAGHLCAGEFYFVLGSSTGTSPGFGVGPGLHVPLNPDPYFDITLLNPNQLPVLSSFGVLNATGHAAASFTLLGGTNPALAGRTASHAFVTLTPGPVVSFVSNPVGVLLVP